MSKKVKGNIGAIGAVLFVIGSAGMAEAIEGRGCFLIAAIVFSVGFGLAYYGWRGEP